LFIAMLGAFAQYFSDSLSKHTSKGLNERALNGLPNGDIPFGHRRLDPNELVGKKSDITIVPKESEAVRQIFQMYASGNHRLASIASWLNSQGFRTHNKHFVNDGNGNIITGPRPFTLYSVRWIVHNPFFAGKVNYRGKEHPGIHQPIIDEDLFNLVQKRLENAHNKSRSLSNIYITS
jgi:site-specific DNA recombinase